ncbi:probable pectinesterase/pectinesterase inhibitor 36 [Olea europaea var. sylvestris]|uniref:probable pectinesterase/pectinesterase inhibitor 36 n=1 Tax=Olea europaea var. sylvestris TaxID=158386 RepID=UPI000C1D0AE7|nr:probable pectinesterase/pectinesterase inhibitor 36 [Olea europaea var. sylvestris]
MVYDYSYINKREQYASLSRVSILSHMNKKNSKKGAPTIEKVGHPFSQKNSSTIASLLCLSLKCLDRSMNRVMQFLKGQKNTAGPQKHQAVALMVASDLSVFYRCSFKGYQDTLLVHSLRQFYRDCQIYGTIDFIFGDAATVFQNCDIFLRRPMDHQANMITAQGRDDPNQNTGISIVNSRVAPTSDFHGVKGNFRNYLGRPWKKYSRAVFLNTDLDGFIDQKGWKEWRGDFALSTLYYAEYMNTGIGASTQNRVKWPGFHVLKDHQEANPFTVKNFIQGDSWIPSTGVPFWAEI